MAPEQKEETKDTPPAGAFSEAKVTNSLPPETEERRHAAPWYVPYLVGGLLEALLYLGVMLYVQNSLYAQEGIVGFFSLPSAYLYPSGILFGLLLSVVYLLGYDTPLTQARLGLFAASMSLTVASGYFVLAIVTALETTRSGGGFAAAMNDRTLRVYLISSFLLFLLANLLFFPALDHYRKSRAVPAQEGKE